MFDELYINLVKGYTINYSTKINFARKIFTISTFRCVLC